MKNSGISYGLNLAKKPGASKSAPAKTRKPVFGADSDSDEEPAKVGNGVQEMAITELDDNVFSKPGTKPGTKPSAKTAKKGSTTQPPIEKPKKPQGAAFGDLSSSFASQKHAQAAAELDPSIYDYDGFHDAYKAQQKAASAAASKDEGERRPRLMGRMLEAARVRERDKQIAEEKKLAREREAEGDEFADRDKFVTEAYRKQQEENRRVEEEERRREQEEASRNKAGGMAALYKQMLNEEEGRHAEALRAAEERLRSGAPAGEDEDEEGEEEEKTANAEDVAREINEKGGSVSVNEDGQVVDKRQLLKGGLNVVAKKKAEARPEQSRDAPSSNDRNARSFLGTGGKQAMRERQSRMLAQQLEQSLKRSREDEEEEKEKVARESKSRKTDSDISSAKERYLARKRAAEEAKRKGSAD